MTIINPLPFNLQNGTIADATQVMADFNQIINNTNSFAAHNGANSDITSLTGLTTPLSPAQGGTGTAAVGGSYYSPAQQVGAFIVQLSSNVPIVAGTNTVVPFDLEVVNNGSGYVNTVGTNYWNPPVAGIALISSYLGVTGANVTSLSLRIFKASVQFANVIVIGSGPVLSAGITIMDAVVPGTIYQVCVQVSGTGSLQVAGSAPNGNSLFFGTYV